MIKQFWVPHFTYLEIVMLSDRIWTLNDAAVSAYICNIFVMGIEYLATNYPTQIILKSKTTLKSLI